MAGERGAFDSPDNIPGENQEIKSVLLPDNLNALITDEKTQQASAALKLDGWIRQERDLVAARAKIAALKSNQNSDSPPMEGVSPMDDDKPPANVGADVPQNPQAKAVKAKTLWGKLGESWRRAGEDATRLHDEMFSTGIFDRGMPGGDSRTGKPEEVPDALMMNQIHHEVERQEMAQRAALNQVAQVADRKIKEAEEYYERRRVDGLSAVAKRAEEELAKASVDQEKLELGRDATQFMKFLERDGHSSTGIFNRHPTTTEQMLEQLSSNGIISKSPSMILDSSFDLEKRTTKANDPSKEIKRLYGNGLAWTNKNKIQTPTRDARIGLFQVKDHEDAALAVIYEKGKNRNYEIAGYAELKTDKKKPAFETVKDKVAPSDELRKMLIDSRINNAAYRSHIMPEQPKPAGLGEPIAPPLIPEPDIDPETGFPVREKGTTADWAEHSRKLMFERAGGDSKDFEAVLGYDPVEPFDPEEDYVPAIHGARHDAHDDTHHDGHHDGNENNDQIEPSEKVQPPLGVKDPDEASDVVQAPETTSPPRSEAESDQPAVVKPADSDAASTPTETPNQPDDVKDKLHVDMQKAKITKLQSRQRIRTVAQGRMESAAVQQEDGSDSQYATSDEVKADEPREYSILPKGDGLSAFSEQVRKVQEGDETFAVPESGQLNEFQVKRLVEMTTSLDDLEALRAEIDARDKQAEKDNKLFGEHTVRVAKDRAGREIDLMLYKRRGELVDAARGHGLNGANALTKEESIKARDKDAEVEEMERIRVRDNDLQEHQKNNDHLPSPVTLEGKDEDAQGRISRVESNTRQQHAKSIVDKIERFKAGTLSAAEISSASSKEEFLRSVIADAVDSGFLRREPNKPFEVASTGTPLSDGIIGAVAGIETKHDRQKLGGPTESAADGAQAEPAAESQPVETEGISYSERDSEDKLTSFSEVVNRMRREDPNFEVPRSGPLSGEQVNGLLDRAKSTEEMEHILQELVGTRDMPVPERFDDRDAELAKAEVAENNFGDEERNELFKRFEAMAYPGADRSAWNEMVDDAISFGLVNRNESARLGIEAEEGSIQSEAFVRKLNELYPDENTKPEPDVGEGEAAPENQSETRENPEEDADKKEADVAQSLLDQIRNINLRERNEDRRQKRLATIYARAVKEGLAIPNNKAIPYGISEPPRATVGSIIFWAGFELSHQKR